MAKIHLVLGGARSGKSRFAEKQARGSGLGLIYLATATAGDEEMQARINRHQADRVGVGWKTIEEPENLANAVEQYSGQDTCILIDCLTLWLTNCLMKNDSKCLHTDYWQEQKGHFIRLLESIQQRGLNQQIIMVSNETGLGVVPMGKLSRDFVDESGFLHQELATIADEVTLVVAGLATKLKGS